MNVDLKEKIIQSGSSQLQISREVGVSDAFFSKVVRGWVNPSAEIKRKIALALGCKVEEVFKEEKDGRSVIPE